MDFGVNCPFNLLSLYVHHFASLNTQFCSLGTIDMTVGTDVMKYAVYSIDQHCWQLGNALLFT